MTLGLGDVDPTPVQINGNNRQGSGLDRTQPAAVDQPEDRRDHQVPDRVSGQRWHVISGLPDRGDLARGVDVGDVTRALAGQRRREQIGGLAEAGEAGLSGRATRDALAVVNSSHEFHGGFRLRTLAG